MWLVSIHTTIMVELKQMMCVLLDGDLPTQVQIPASTVVVDLRLPVWYMWAGNVLKV
jgi:hypothetical protein